jgi:tRNA(fMet)-specific endonuclease VapC
MRYVLDTDHLSFLQKKQQPEFDRLSARLEQVPEDDVCTTVINFQEQVLGWTSYLSRARTADAIVKAYDELLMIESYYRDFHLLAFGAAAQTRFDELRRRKIRIPTLDLRIACIALAPDMLLLTRNTRDFGRVPGLAFEDWSR